MRIASQHPAGLAGLGSALLVIVARQVGIELSPEETAAVIGAITAVVSAFSPRLVVEAAE